MQVAASNTANTTLHDKFAVRAAEIERTEQTKTSVANLPVIRHWPTEFDAVMAAR